MSLEKIYATIIGSIVTGLIIVFGIAIFDSIQQNIDVCKDDPNSQACETQKTISGNFYKTINILSIFGDIKTWLVIFGAIVTILVVWIAKNRSSD